MSFNYLPFTPAVSHVMVWIINPEAIGVIKKGRGIFSNFSKTNTSWNMATLASIFDYFCLIELTLHFGDPSNVSPYSGISIKYDKTSYSAQSAIVGEPPTRNPVPLSARA